MKEIDGFDALKAALSEMCTALLAFDVPEETVFDSKLVASELLVNALRYGGGRAYFSFAAVRGGIEICVRGSKPFRPPERVARADVTAERGRGLFLVDSLVSERNYSEEKGTCVILRFSS